MDAVSVVVALLMVALIGLAAVSLDVAGLWAKRQQLQIGADAGALAIAQDCGRGNCGSPAQTAQSLAQLNLNDGTATATLLNSVTASSRDGHGPDQRRSAASVRTDPRGESDGP